MAKVTGPLFSFSASGKIADAMVHFSWKGVNVVRQWVVPTNKMTSGQGNIRTIIGNLGRACGLVAVGKTFALKLVALGIIPDQQTKQSYLVQKIKDTYLAGAGATLRTNYSTQLAELKAHTKSNAFRSGASAMSLTAFDMAYDNIASFDLGLGVYLLAKTAIALGFTGTPYTLAFASWTKTAVLAMASDMRTKTS